MIRYANAGDLEQIRSLWENCFPDDSGFNDYFFENLFSLENVLLFEENERIHAMTQMIPRKLKLSSEITEPCTYIYGACTHPDHRRQHLMAQLLERSFVLDRSLGRKASILIPAEPWLFGFYRKFDYLPVFMLNTKEIDVSCSDTQTLSMLSADNIGQISSLYNDLLTDRIPYLVREHTEWKKQIEMFTILGLGCFGIFSEDGTLDGYAFAWKPEGGVVYIQELASRSAPIKDALINGIAVYSNAGRVRYSDLSVSTERFGCMKRYDGIDFSCAYMNLMMN